MFDLGGMITDLATVQILGFLGSPGHQMVFGHVDARQVGLMTTTDNAALLEKLGAHFQQWTNPIINV